jgi:hypothetical protein
MKHWEAAGKNDATYEKHVLAAMSVNCYKFSDARLNVVAGATDASRAMLLTSCCKVELLTAIFGFL